MEMYHEQVYANMNRLEAALAMYWPEVMKYLKPETATLKALLIEFGSRCEVAKWPEEARKLMSRVGGRMLSHKKIRQVEESASSSVGVIPTKGEVEGLKELVSEIDRTNKALRRAEKKVEVLSQEDKAVQAIGAEIGKVTGAVLVTTVGDPNNFESSSSFLKAMGLNLKERSSGKHRGQVRITKRGPGKARKYLYLAVLRLIQKDIIARAWYERKVHRDGGKVKKKAVIALMRKYARALYYVARGEKYDSQKLFDICRLKLVA
jgi:transposase